MCYTFVHDRYLVHPKQKHELRAHWCRLVNFKDFKEKALPAGKTKTPKAGGAAKAKAAAGAKATAVKAKATAKPKAVTIMKSVAKAVPKSALPHLPLSAKSAALAPQHRPAVKAPMTPVPSKAAVGSPAKPSLTPLTPQKPTAVGSSPVHPTTTVISPSPDGKTPEAFDRELTPAEAMHGLSGKQLQAFQMVMTRMERLERENQELMQLLLQMQGLLQQQQQRNAKLTTQAAAFQGNGVDQAPAATSAAAAPFPATTPPRGAPQTVPAPAPGLPRPLKRKASVAEDVLAGPPRSAEESHYRAASEAVDEAAPWKSQRKRQRRSKTGLGANVLGSTQLGGTPPRAAQGMVAMPLVGVAPGAPPPPPPLPPPPPQARRGIGMDAYHDALLGN